MPEHAGNWCYRHQTCEVSKLILLSAYTATLSRVVSNEVGWLHHYQLRASAQGTGGGGRNKRNSSRNATDSGNAGDGRKRRS